MADSTVAVHGYREFLRAADHAGKESKKAVRDTFRQVGDVVRVEWTREFGVKYDARSAAGYRTSVRQRGVQVGQSLRKTTGLRPDYGRLQQRVGETVLQSKEGEIVRDMDRALDRVAEHFEAKP
jgi:hypothetical protein